MIASLNNSHLIGRRVFIVDAEKCPHFKNFIDVDRKAYGTWHNYIAVEKIPLVEVKIIGETIGTNSDLGLSHPFHQFIVHVIDTGQIKCVVPHQLVKISN